MNQREQQMQETSILRLLEVMSIKDTLVFMNKQKQVHDSIIPKCICTTGMSEYEYDDEALLRLQAKLLQVGVEDEEDE